MYLNTSKALGSRRRFLRKLASTGAFFTVPGLYSEALATIAPRVTQGPYYPLEDDIPLDKDNDLVQLDDNLTPAAGQINYLSGRILDANGDPVRGALVELWHADREGDYVYSTGTGRNADCDENFAGFGQFLTSSSGAYIFRTVKAGLYTGRTRHFHLAVTIPGQLTRYCTQTGWNETALDLNGSSWATQNSNDNIFSTLTTEEKALVLLDFAAVEDAVADEVAATFDFQVGLTPVEPSYPDEDGFVARGEVVAGADGGQRYKIAVSAYDGYTYEIYGNPTLADLAWRSLPFSLEQGTAVDRHKYTATEEGLLNFYVDTAAERGFYKVSFRVPGANTGTPGTTAGGGG